MYHGAMIRSVSIAQGMTMDVSERRGAAAFLIGILFNQGQRAERGWEAPFMIEERLGTLDPLSIAELDEGRLADALVEAPSVHRYARVMARYLHRSCIHLCSNYGGDARRVWTPATTAVRLKTRLMEFPGIGEHKAAVAIHLLRYVLRVPVRSAGEYETLASTCPTLGRLDWQQVPRAA